jgi:hypothetical protein
MAAGEGSGATGNSATLGSDSGWIFVSRSPHAAAAVAPRRSRRTPPPTTVRVPAIPSNCSTKESCRPLSSDTFYKKMFLFLF